VDPEEEEKEEGVLLRMRSGKGQGLWGGKEKGGPFFFSAIRREKGGKKK